MILRDKKPVETAPKQAQTYPVSSLGDDWSNILQILLNAHKIEITKKNKEMT